MRSKCWPEEEGRLCLTLNPYYSFIPTEWSFQISNSLDVRNDRQAGFKP